MNQRLRLEVAGARAAVVSEQQSQMTESRDGKKLRFEHRTTTDGRQTSLVKGEAPLGDDGKGEARFTDPEGQTVALPVGTLFPVAIARETVRQAKAGESGLRCAVLLWRKGEAAAVGQHRDRQGAQAARRREDPRGRGAAGRRPLADLLPRWLLRLRRRDKGQGEPAFEMSSITLDNGIELYGTHEESDGGIEYRITRLEPLPKPECK